VGGGLIGWEGVGWGALGRSVDAGAGLGYARRAAKALASWGPEERRPAPHLARPTLTGTAPPTEPATALPARTRALTPGAGAGESALTLAVGSEQLPAAEAADMEALTVRGGRGKGRGLGVDGAREAAGPAASAPASHQQLNALWWRPDHSTSPSLPPPSRAAPPAAPPVPRSCP
jgi:hypothetical protein